MNKIRNNSLRRDKSSKYILKFPTIKKLVWFVYLSYSSVLREPVQFLFITKDKRRDERSTD